MAKHTCTAENGGLPGSQLLFPLSTLSLEFSTQRLSSHGDRWGGGHERQGPQRLGRGALPLQRQAAAEILHVPPHVPSLGGPSWKHPWTPLDALAPPCPTLLQCLTTPWGCRSSPHAPWRPLALPPGPAMRRASGAGEQCCRVRALTSGAGGGSSTAVAGLTAAEQCPGSIGSCQLSPLPAVQVGAGAAGAGALLALGGGLGRVDGLRRLHLHRQAAP